jgi:hypothetical protein
VAPVTSMRPMAALHDGQAGPQDYYQIDGVLNSSELEPWAHPPILWPALRVRMAIAGARSCRPLRRKPPPPRRP